MAGQFVPEADVAVRAVAQMIAVDPHVAVGHDAVEVDRHAPGGVRLGNPKGFPVPADSGGQKRAALSGGGFLVERAFDRPVVREVSFRQA